MLPMRCKLEFVLLLNNYCRINVQPLAARELYLVLRTSHISIAGLFGPAKDLNSQITMKDIFIINKNTNE